MAEQALLGWQGGGQVLNDKKIAILDHYGPTSYTVITPGTPPAQPTGGDSISAKACGLVQIEAVIVLGDSSGTYGGRAFCPAASRTGAPSGQGGSATSVPLQWITSATGAEVGAVNLSAVALRIVVIGY